MELESDTYDVVVIGTGLSESLAAVSLANSGKTVLHLDPNEYYGASQASLTLDELSSWADKRSRSETSAGPSTSTHYLDAQRRRYTHASTSTLTPELEASRRRYALSLYPALLPSRGSLISTLISSGVSNYVGFRILDSVSVWQDDTNESGGSVKRVPGSKEEVFKDKSISLVDKRRLMKFLMFVAGEFEDDEILRGKEEIPLPDFLSQSFSLPPRLCQEITYAIAHCSSPTEATLPALHRTRRYLKSIGRYGPSAFLIGQFGGAGEIAQGFCRACAVKGGTYILGSQAEIETINISSPPESESPISIKLACHPRPITSKHLIASRDHLPPTLLSAQPAAWKHRITAHCIAILPSFPSTLKRSSPAEEEDESNEDDTAVVLFPPKGERGLVRGLIMGEGTGSCPVGQFVLYLSTVIPQEGDPSSIFRPYIDRLGVTPSFEAFYLSHESQPSTGASTAALDLTSVSDNVIIIEPYSQQELMTEGLDWEAEQGEKAFWRVMGDKNSLGEGVKGWWEKDEEAANGDDEEEAELQGI